MLVFNMVLNLEKLVVSLRLEYQLSSLPDGNKDLVLQTLCGLCMYLMNHVIRNKKCVKRMFEKNECEKVLQVIYYVKKKKEKLMEESRLKEICFV